MEPSSVKHVEPVLRTVSQKFLVSKESTKAIDPPFMSIRYVGMVPPAWNSGRLTKLRSSEESASKEKAHDAICKYEQRTPFEGPVVPDVYITICVSHGISSLFGAVGFSPEAFNESAS